MEAATQPFDKSRSLHPLDNSTRGRKQQRNLDAGTCTRTQQLRMHGAACAGIYTRVSCARRGATRCRTEQRKEHEAQTVNHHTARCGGACWRAGANCQA